MLYSKIYAKKAGITEETEKEFKTEETIGNSNQKSPGGFGLSAKPARSRILVPVFSNLLSNGFIG
ncbi:hypothetical protein [Dysosmobacter welbionis]